MRRVAVNFIAAFTVMVLALAFGECACDDEGAGGHTDGPGLCLVSCTCHGASLVLENSSPVAPCSDRQSYRSGDEQVHLPLAVADIFNPPKV